MEADVHWGLCRQKDAYMGQDEDSNWDGFCVMVLEERSLSLDLSQFGSGVSRTFA